MARTLLIVERNKAGFGYRLANYFIDFAFSVVIIWILLLVGILLLFFINGTSTDESFDYIENFNPLGDRILTLLLYAFIMFVTEKLSGGRSLGKLITGTKVVKSDGSELTTDDLLKRNFSRAVPFDQLSFLGSNGWHDRWSDTNVVRFKAFEKANNLEKDMESIGAKEILE